MGRGLLHLQGLGLGSSPGLGSDLGLGLGPEVGHWPGPGTRPGHHARYSSLSYCPSWLLIDPFSLTADSQGTPEGSDVFPLWLVSLGVKEGNHAGLCTCCI